MTTFDSEPAGALAGGGAAVLLASTGGALRAFDAAGRPPTDDDCAPWRLWDDPAIAGTPLALVAAGVLAANPHDTPALAVRRKRERDRDFRRSRAQSRRDGRLSPRNASRPRLRDREHGARRRSQRLRRGTDRGGGIAETRWTRGKRRFAPRRCA